MAQATPTKEERNNKIFTLRKEGMTYIQIGRIFDISKERVGNILNGYKKVKPYYRSLIIRRDNGKCLDCGSKENLEVHHKDTKIKSRRGSNLVTLCRKHHILADVLNRKLNKK